MRKCYSNKSMKMNIANTWQQSSISQVVKINQQNNKISAI